MKGCRHSHGAGAGLLSSMLLKRRAAAGMMVNRSGPCPARFPLPAAITGPGAAAGAGVVGAARLRGPQPIVAIEAASTESRYLQTDSQP